MYENLIKALRVCADTLYNASQLYDSDAKDAAILYKAADAIEDLSRLAEVNAKRAMKWAADAEKAEKAPCWIPVTERCPEKSGDYLVFDDCRNLYVNEWHCLLKKWQYDDSRITHWRPLPEPPKEET